MSHLLDDILQAGLRGETAGIPSLCTAHPRVLGVAMQGGDALLIESTCNQVNQAGGYTGMTPLDFRRLVERLAVEKGFSVERILLGGDHLGPYPWRFLPAEQALLQAEEMVRVYVRAGFQKIHLDASMKLGDDASLPLETIARRTARLARAAEDCSGIPGELRYVVGSEVPLPGGVTSRQESFSVTAVQDVENMLRAMQGAFQTAGLAAAWDRLAAVVVQPGVEYGDDFIQEYDPLKASPLAEFVAGKQFVFEAHSTDYQSPASLANLVRDHFAILKVGPALTFAFREAVFSLAMIEAELIPEGTRSHLTQVLEEVMLREPRHWQEHYHGTERELMLKRKYSLSDRSRYYWNDPRVQAALHRLLENLRRASIPIAMLSQFSPHFYEHVQQGLSPNTLDALIDHSVRTVLHKYRDACRVV